MPPRWKLGLALLAISIAGPLSAQPLSAQGMISRCASQADTRLTGLSALRKVCPDLEPALGQLGLNALLPSGWRTTLTAGGLTDLGTLLQRYAGSPPSRPPRSAVLRSIATALVPATPPPTWSEQVRAWIQHWIDVLFQWLQSLHPSAAHPQLARAIIYCLVALLLGAVLLLAFALGSLIRQRHLSARPRGEPVAADFMDPAAAQSDDSDWTRLRDQPTRILRLLVEALTRAHRLERDRHLTCRELEAQARLDTETEREGFARLARLAERELYGPPGSTVLPEDILRDMRMLHARLLAAAVQAGEIRR